MKENAFVISIRGSGRVRMIVYGVEGTRDVLVKWLENNYDEITVSEGVVSFSVNMYEEAHLIAENILSIMDDNFF